MSIFGLDAWLTSPPEQTDWQEEAEKVLKWEPRDEREAHLLSIIAELHQIILDEQTIFAKINE